MPKCQYVDPGKAFDAGYIHFEDIPVCQYKKTLAEEKKIYTKEDFMRIYRDMAIIREFETMLNEVKVKSCYNGVEYNNPGPAHLSIGQEASAVGEAYCLDINDFSFGHNSSIYTVVFTQSTVFDCTLSNTFTIIHITVNKQIPYFIP